MFCVLVSQRIAIALRCAEYSMTSSLRRLLSGKYAVVRVVHSMMLPSRSIYTPNFLILFSSLVLLVLSI